MLTKQSIDGVLLETAIDELSMEEQGNDAAPTTTTVTTRTNGTVTQVTLSAPDGEASPQELVFVLDVSGSM